MGSGTKVELQAQVGKSVVEPVADFQLAGFSKAVSGWDFWRTPSASLGDNALRPWRSKSQSSSPFSPRDDPTSAQAQSAGPPQLRAPAGVTERRPG